MERSSLEGILWEDEGLINDTELRNRRLCTERNGFGEVLQLGIAPAGWIRPWTTFPESIGDFVAGNQDCGCAQMAGPPLPKRKCLRGTGWETKEENKTVEEDDEEEPLHVCWQKFKVHLNP